MKRKEEEMNHLCGKEAVGLRQNRLLMALERLLEFPTTDVHSTLEQGVQLAAEGLAVEKVDIFFHDAATDSLVLFALSDVLMGERQQATGTDRLLLVNGGHLVEVFLTGIAYLSGHADGEAEKSVGPGVQSEIATVIEVEMHHRGLLLASSSLPECFSQPDLHFLQAVAYWIGMVLHRAEIIERVRQESIERDRRLAAEELLTIMAHDLRNYLTPLKGRLSLLEKRARCEGREQDMHDALAASNTLRLFSRVISDLLDVTRLNHGIFTIHPQPIVLVELIQEVVSAFSGAERLICVCAPDKVLLSADPDRLQQVLENLLANAVKYAPRHTPITVGVSRERRTDGAWVLLAVSNEGEGIPPKLRTHLFQPFVAGETSTGLGLGLYVANRIATAHYGTLMIDSVPGQGVRVTLALPLEDEDMLEYDQL